MCPRIYVCVCVCVYTVHVCMYICVYVHVCMCPCIYICVCVYSACIYVCVRVYGLCARVCVRPPTPPTCADLSVCLGERLPALFRELMLPWEGVERRLSLGGGGLAGRAGGAAGIEPRAFFLLEGGMREEGSTEGTASFSRARYTRCIA